MAGYRDFSIGTFNCRPARAPRLWNPLQGAVPVARPDTSLQQALVQRWRLLQHMGGLTLIAAVAWLLSVTIYGLQELVLQRYDVKHYISENIPVLGMDA